MTTMSKYIYAFLIGFSTNACIWRIDAGKHDDIIFPAFVCVLGFLVFIIESRNKNHQHNRG